MGVFNEQFDILLQDSVFTNTLNLVIRSSIDDPILDRLCTDVLPRIHYNVKHLILEPIPVERILLAGNYPNLTSLTLFNFRHDIISSYFIEESIFQHILKHKITELILDNKNIEISWEDYSTFDDLPNLKCFSLICYRSTNTYDTQVIPLLRRMSYLEKLTLYIRPDYRTTFIDGTYLHKEILNYMQRLHAFVFFISTEIEINDTVYHISENDIQTNFYRYRLLSNVDFHSYKAEVIPCYSLIEYPHLTSLEMISVDDY
ncbi:unnamed protein product [Rotaria sordida]|uniref:Uncharacterized protein n=1 Tax=Rotaria sordida TaxID=392033 RepID=A0A815AQ22_9BILA|nr:unnamed protein product [Rotaria sordida]